MDDVGPATSATHGGEIQTPTLDRVAGQGISYNRFHTTAMCSPTRASLLTGRNHTRVGNGQIAAIANDFDGFKGVIPKSSATMAEVLKAYGYNTGAWGKWHNTPEEQITSKEPFEYWTSGDSTPRPQFHHVNDIAPTIYEVLDIPAPQVVNGFSQEGFDGVSMAYTFDDASANGQKNTQFFDIMASRGFYQDGWFASARGPREPWVGGIPKGIRE